MWPDWRSSWRGRRPPLPTWKPRMRRGKTSQPPRLAPGLQRAQALQKRIQEALSELTRDGGKARINLTGPDAQSRRTRHGILPGYNTQVPVTPLNPDAAGRTGMLLTAAAVVSNPSDHRQLLPLPEQAEAATGILHSHSGRCWLPLRSQPGCLRRPGAAGGDPGAPSPRRRPAKARSAIGSWGELPGMIVTAAISVNPLSKSGSFLTHFRIPTLSGRAQTTLSTSVRRAGPN